MAMCTMLSVEELAAGVQAAKDRMEKSKLCYYGGSGSYEEMTQAAKGLAKLLDAYMQTKHPGRRIAPIRWQSLLRSSRIR